MSNETKKTLKEDAYKIRFGLKSRLVLLIVLLIIGIMSLVYRFTMSDEERALMEQMRLRGGDLVRMFADQAIIRVDNAIMNLNLKKNEKLKRKHFLRFQETMQMELGEAVDKVKGVPNVEAIFVINQFSQILVHSDSTIPYLTYFNKVVGPEIHTYKTIYTKRVQEFNEKLSKEANESKIVDKKAPKKREKHEISIKEIGFLSRIKKEDPRDITPILQSFSLTNKDGTVSKMIDVSYPLLSAAGKFKTYKGEAHIIMSLKEIIITIRNSKAKVQAITIVAIFLGIIGAIILATLIVNPIKRLVVAMRKVAQGDLEQNLKISSSDEIGLLTDNFNKMIAGLREREKFKDTIGRLASGEVAEYLMSADKGELGGDLKKATMLFSDIRSFTTYSEKHTPQEVVEMLNGYLNRMTNIILDNKGVLDKYVGDEIMAVFGAPITRTDDAYRACKSALEMVPSLEQYNKERALHGEEPISIGVGINSGDVIAGNMGSEKRMDYTVIGDDVNLGARLEGTNKEYGTMIIISEFTYNIVKEYFYVRELDIIRVKGKSKPVAIYELIDFKEGKEPPESKIIETQKK